MTKREVKEIMDRDILIRLESVIWFIKNDARNNARREVNNVMRLIWTANSLGVIKFDEWKTITEFLHDLEFKMSLSGLWEEIKETTY